MRRITVTLMAGLAMASSQVAMQFSSLNARKANDPGRQWTRRPRARVAVVTGLVAVALLGGPSAATLARSTPSAAAQLAADKTVASVNLGSGAVPANCGGNLPIIDYHHGTPRDSYVPGNGNYNLYFNSSGPTTSFCSVTASTGPFSGGIQFYDKGTGLCLALNSTTKHIYEGSTTACANEASYTVWLLQGATGGNYFLYQSAWGTNLCIYDDLQSPSTYATCNASNQFEWMIQVVTPM